MNEKKPCPVDRGKLLIGLELCNFGSESPCSKCPYYDFSGHCLDKISRDALTYIYWLEEQNDTV